MRSFVKIKPSRNGKITLSFIYIGKSCLNREFFASLMCLLMLYAKIKLSQKFPNLHVQYKNLSYKSLLSNSSECALIGNGGPKRKHDWFEFQYGDGRDIE